MSPAAERRMDAEPSASDALGTSSSLSDSPRHDLVGSGASLPAAPPGGARLLDWLRRSGRGVAALVGAWALWLLAATQLSQASAPSPLSDGLTRGDWISLEALGLHTLGNGLPLWLLVALTLAFAIGVATLGRGPRARPALGRTVAPMLIGLFALTVWIVAIAAAAYLPAPRWLELPVTESGATALQPAQELAFEQGRWQRSAAAVGSCVAADDAMRCVLPDGGEPLVFAGTQAVERDGLLWTRRGIQSDAESAAGRLELDDGLSGQGRVGFDVGAERATIIPALRARVALVGTKRSGPILTARIGDGATRLLESPGLASGPALARLRSIHRLRLQGASPWAGRLGLLAAAGAVVAALLLVLRSSAPSVVGARNERETVAEGPAELPASSKAPS